MAKCPDCGGNLSEISSKFSRCDGCGKIWWNNNPAISAEKPSENAVSSSPVRGGAGAGSAPAKEASEEKREAKVEKISERKASDSKSAEQREIEELRARLQAMEERTAAQERSRYDTKAKRDKTSFKNTPAYEVARKWGLKVILPIFLILIALITLLSCFCGLRGIYVNVDNPNEFYSFTATKYEYHGTLFGEEYVDKDTWKKSDGKLELTYKDEFFGKITDSYEFSIKDSYKIITVTDDFGIEREYKRVSLMAYSTPQKVTVKFHINDGSENADIKRVDLGARVAEPEAPVRNGYEFMGWYTDKEGWRNGEGEQFSENDRVWEKTEYYANWKSTAEYSLTGDFIKETLKFKEGADLKALYAANVTNELLKGEWEIIFVQEANEDNVVDGSLAPAANVVARLVSVVIPDSVTSIGDYAFYICTGLTSVTIPDSVTSIGRSAFSGCTGLTSVTIGNSVESIGSSVFYGCTGLTSVTIPDSVTSIGNYAFYNCTGLTSVTIGNSVESIGSSVFYGCTGLTSVTIGNSVESIGDSAFEDCTGLTSVIVGNAVTSIGRNAFYGCYKLVEVYNKSSLDITAGSSDYGYAGYYAKNVYTEENGSWFTDTADGYRFIYDGAKGYLVGYYGEATDITLPDSFSAYDGTTVNTYEIYQYAFYGNTALTSVVIPDSVTSIGSYAFSYCTVLTSVTIGNSVESIGREAFSGCTGLTSITISDSVTSIGSGAFDSCTNLVQKENGVSYVDKWVIDCDTSVSEVTLRNGTVGIGDWAFSGCTGLTSVTIGNSVTSIGNYAFYGCTGLTSVTIPDSVTSIGEGAFSGCSSLESITIPFVGAEAGKTSSDTYQYPFGYIFGTFSYTGGTGVYQHYYGDSTSSTTSTRYYIPSSLRNVTVTGGNILRGAFFGCSMLTSVTIPDSVTSIESAVFSGCAGLTSVTIPDSVKSIGSNAFYNCTGLTSVTIGNSVTSIGDYAFYICTRLTSVTIPDSVTSIGSYAFSDCTGLTPVTIPDSVTSIGVYAFQNCKGLTSVVFEDTEGWQVSRNFSRYTSLSSADLANTSTAAKYLRSTYDNYFWRKVK